MEGKKVGELTLCVKLKGVDELQERLASAADHIDAAREILDSLADGVELGADLIASDTTSRSGEGGRGMTGKSYELPDDITTLGGMVTWADKDAEWHTEVFEFLADARYAFREHVLAGDPAYLARLVELDRRQALDPVSYDVMEIDPAPGEWPFGRGRG